MSKLFAEAVDDVRRDWRNLLEEIALAITRLTLRRPLLSCPICGRFGKHGGCPPNEKGGRLRARPEWRHLLFAVLASVVAWAVFVTFDHVLAAVYLGWRP